jgi:hypothetical protein
VEVSEQLSSFQLAQLTSTLSKRAGTKEQEKRLTGLYKTNLRKTASIVINDNSILTVDLLQQDYLTMLDSLRKNCVADAKMS